MRSSVAEDYLDRLRGKKRRGSKARRAARHGAERVAEATAAPRRGAKRLVSGVIGQIPHYVRLLTGLMTDPRVARLDKVLVAIALAYVLLPTDLIADFIPFFGQVDDVYLVMLALERLVNGAGRRVLRSHWTGDPRHLRELDIRAVVSAAAFFLPSRLRRNLHGMTTARA